MFRRSFFQATLAAVAVWPRRLSSRHDADPPANFTTICTCIYYSKGRVTEIIHGPADAPPA